MLLSQAQSQNVAKTSPSFFPSGRQTLRYLFIAVVTYKAFDALIEIARRKFKAMQSILLNIPI